MQLCIVQQEESTNGADVGVREQSPEDVMVTETSFYEADPEPPEYSEPTTESANPSFADILVAPKYTSSDPNLACIIYFLFSERNVIE